MLNRLRTIARHIAISPLSTPQQLHPATISSSPLLNPARALSTTAMASSQEPSITLYTAQTPNGVKISIALEELGLPYKVRKILFSKNEQKEDWYTAINPNGRIPALSDTFDDGEPIHLFESGGIFVYLTEKYDKDHKISYPHGTREYFQMWNWVFFQNAGVGPMQGQANHFSRYAPEKIQYAQDRYLNETRRLYGVLDKHLASSKSGYIVGDHVSVADITTFGWASWAAYAGVDMDPFKHVIKWIELMGSRPGVDKGRNVPDGDRVALLKDEEGRKRMEEEAAEGAKWIQAGMKDDAKK